jgi:hypothetical protein
LDNSFTYSDATFTFFSLCECEDEEEASIESDPSFLSIEGFITALKRIARQNAVIREAANHAAASMQESKRALSGDLEIQWTSLRRHIAEILGASPRSDEDSILNTFILSEPVQTICFHYDLKLQQVYKRYLRVQCWEELAERPSLRMSKTDIQRSLRDVLLQKNQGSSIRQDDLAAAVRMGNHENTAKDNGTRDTASGDVTYPEWLEIVCRCALGSTPLCAARLGPALGDPEPLPGSPAAGSAGDLFHPDERRPFDAELATAEYAAARVRSLLEFMWEWLQDIHTDVRD